MNRLLITASALAAALLGAAPGHAADSEALNSTALILKPFVLTKLSDLSFGSIIPTGSAEFVRINADTGARTMTSESMRITSDEGFRAEFASSGVNNNLVVLELDGPDNLVNADGDLLKVTKLVLDKNNKILRVLTAASQVFFVGIGGEVYIRGNQEEGKYSGEFTLTATYI